MHFIHLYMDLQSAAGIFNYILFGVKQLNIPQNLNAFLIVHMKRKKIGFVFFF